MYLVIGLGNPDEKYNGTRHNVGQEVVRSSTDNWKLEKKLFAEIAKNNDAIYALPTTYMNDSGKCVKKIISQFPNFLISNLIIVHDDIDLPLGTLRISVDSGAGGHNGVQSIIDNLGTKEFTRVRIGVSGIGRARTNAAAYVLKKFTKGEQTNLKSTLDRARKAMTMILKDGADRAMNTYNQKEIST